MQVAYQMDVVCRRAMPASMAESAAAERLFGERQDDLARRKGPRAKS